MWWWSFLKVKSKGQSRLFWKSDTCESKRTWALGNKFFTLGGEGWSFMFSWTSSSWCHPRPYRSAAPSGMLYEMWRRKYSKQNARGGCNLENSHLAQVPLNTNQKHSKTFTYSILNFFSLSQRKSISEKKKKKMKLVNGDDSKPTVHLKTPEHTFHSKERWTIRTGTKGADTLGSSTPRAAAGEE